MRLSRTRSRAEPWPSTLVRWICPALFGLVACSSSEGPPDPSSMHLNVFGPAEDFPGLSMTVRGVAMDRVFTLGSLVERTPTQFESEVFAVPGDGRLTVTVELGEGGEIVASGTRTVHLRPDFGWGISVFRSDTEPGPGFCLGEATRHAIAPSARRSPDDSIWITVGGVPNGAVC